MTTALATRPTTHDDVDRLVERVALGTLLSVQSRTANMTKPECDAWLVSQIEALRH